MTRIFVRVAYGVLRAAWPLWLAWAALCAGAAWLVASVGAPGDAVWSIVAVAVCVLATLVVHEFGHAGAAYLLGARGLRLERVGFAVAVSHEPTTPRRDGVVAAAGPGLSLAVAVALALAGGRLSAPPLMIAACMVGVGAYSLLPWTVDGRHAWRGLTTRSPSATAG